MDLEEDARMNIRQYQHSTRKQGTRLYISLPWTGVRVNRAYNRTVHGGEGLSNVQNVPSLSMRRMIILNFELCKLKMLFLYIFGFRESCNFVNSLLKTKQVWLVAMWAWLCCAGLYRHTYYIGTGVVSTLAHVHGGIWYSSKRPCSCVFVGMCLCVNDLATLKEELQMFLSPHAIHPLVPLYQENTASAAFATAAK